MTDIALRWMFAYYDFVDWLDKTVATAWPVGFSFSLVAGVLEYFLPGQQLKDAILSVVGLMLLDMLTGVVAASRKGVPVESSKIGRTALKIAGVLAIVGTIAFALHGVPKMDAFIEPVATVTTSVFIFRETVSIMENLSMGGIKVPKPLMRFLKGKLADAEEAGIE